MDLWHRGKGMRAHSLTQIRIKVQRHDHPERTNIAFVLHDDTLCKFLLHEHDDVLKGRGLGVSMIARDDVDEGRRNLVGNVGDDSGDVGRP